MLRVVVYINFTPIIDTHAVRLAPMKVRENTLCTYKTEDGGVLKQRFQMGPGAAKLAIRLLKRFCS